MNAWHPEFKTNVAHITVELLYSFRLIFVGLCLLTIRLSPLKKSIASGILYGYFIIIAWGQIPSDGLLAYYPFDGDAWDSSGNGHHGIVHGATPATDRFGKPNAALYFYNAWVEIPDTSTLRPYNFTYTFWFNLKYDQSSFFICKPRGPGQEPTFGIWLRASSIQSYVTRPQQETYLRSPLWVACTGRWHHLAISADYTTREYAVWVDGRLFAQVPLNVTQEYGNQPWVIGAAKVDSNFNLFLYGRMDDLRLYNRALRKHEIYALASDRPGGKPQPPDWMHEAPAAGRYVILESETDGVPNSRPRKIELSDQAPLWQRPWFVLTGLSLLFGLCFFALRLRHRQRERLRRLELNKWKALEAERGRIARDLHDDLGSGLSAISLLSEVARQKSAGGPVDEEMHQLAAASHDLSVRIREIIWMVSARNDRLDYLISYLGNYVVEHFEHSALELNLRLPDEIPPVLVGGEQRRALFQAVKEGLRIVAMQHDNRRLNVSFHLNSHLDVQIEWDGSTHLPADSEQTTTFQQLIKKLRENGGGFSTNEGRPVQWQFRLPI